MIEGMKGIKSIMGAKTTGDFDDEQYTYTASPHTLLLFTKGKIVNSQWNSKAATTLTR